jgi:cytosine/adenosine deaminase-related metal-dependent hydrolase
MWRQLTPEAVYVGAMVGIGELLLTGCTTTTDHFYVYPKGLPGNLLDETIKAARELGIRFYPTRGSISLGQSQGGLPPDDLTQTEEEILQDSRRVIENYHDSSAFSMCRIGLSPNAPFSATASLMKNTVRLAREAKVMCHTHLAETKDEEVYCLEKFNRRPLQYLEDLEWIGEDIWFAHGIHFNDEELEKLARSKTKIAHCPSSNSRLGSGVAPYPKWKEKKVIFGLGVDGSASNDSSNMWGEVRQFLLAHRGAWGSEIMTPYEALKCATRNGAELLDWREIGSLEPGKAADLILIDTRKIAYAGASYDPVAALVLCGDNFIVDTSVVNGKIVVEKGKLTQASEEKIVEAADHIISTLWMSGVQ